MGLIQNTVNKFIDNMKHAEEQLTSFSIEVDNKRILLETELERFKNVSQDLKGASDGCQGTVAEAMIAAKDSVHKTIEGWSDKIKNTSREKEFINEHQKKLVVMVFGAVKTGKSTLGNFLAGKNFRESSIDTEYKSLPKAQFVVAESARENGEIVADENGDYWFAEGVTDTTGSIQYFTLSGLRWFDSPGTGALAQENDKRNMEEMVKQYIDYTDLCIFLQNSGNPCLRDDMKYIERLSRDNQEAVVVFTKSDKAKMQRVDGTFKRVFVPKDEATRKNQENDACQRVKVMYPNMDSNKYRAISISTFLAEAALKENDDEKFKASNLPLFMEILGNKAKQDSLRLKQQKPKKLLNNFIDSVINGSEGQFDGTVYLSDALNRILKEVDQYKKELDGIVRLMAANVASQVRRDVQEKAMIWAQDVEHSKTEISDSVIRDAIFESMNRIIERELNKRIGTIINNYEQQSIDCMTNDVTFGSIKKQTQKAEIKYTEHIVESRSADGLWENFKSLFGARYYTTRTVDKVRSFTIDMGTNVDDFLDAAMPAVQDIASSTVRKELEYVRDSYFKPQEEYATAMLKELAVLEKNIQELKYVV